LQRSNHLVVVFTSLRNASGKSFYEQIHELTILPAFFDNDAHLGEASRNSLFVGVGQAASIAELVELVRQRAAQTPPGAQNAPG
jgi:hypothetical protein